MAILTASFPNYGSINSVCKLILQYLIRYTKYIKYKIQMYSLYENVSSTGQTITFISRVFAWFLQGAWLSHGRTMFLMRNLLEVKLWCRLNYNFLWNGTEWLYSQSIVSKFVWCTNSSYILLDKLSLMY